MKIKRLFAQHPFYSTLVAILAVFILIFVFMRVTGVQLRDLDWIRAANIAPGVSHEYGKAVTSDQYGNIYVAGNFSGDISIGGNNFSSPSRDGGIYIAQYSPNMTEVNWSTALTNTDGVSVEDIAVNVTAGGCRQQGPCPLTVSVFISGKFFSSLAVGNMALTSVGRHDGFLANLVTNSDATSISPGEWSWATTVNGDDNGDDVANAISVDPITEEVYVTGAYNGDTVIFYNSNGSQIGSAVLPAPIASNAETLPPLAANNVEIKNTASAFDAFKNFFKNIFSSESAKAAGSPLAPLGDVNRNYSITSADAQAVLDFLSDPGTNPLDTAEQQVLADVDCDHTVTSADANMIQQYVDGTITEFSSCPLYLADQVLSVNSFTVSNPSPEIIGGETVYTYPNDINSGDTVEVNGSGIAINGFGDRISAQILPNGTILYSAPLTGDDHSRRIDFTFNVAPYLTPGQNTIVETVIDRNSSTTVVRKVINVVASPDTTPPTVTAVSPTDSSTDVPINTDIAVTFSEPMDTVNGVTYRLRTYEGETIGFTSTGFDETGTIYNLQGASLNNGTTYYLAISEARDVAENYMSGTFESSFRTVAAASPTLRIDNFSPTTVDEDYLTNYTFTVASPIENNPRIECEIHTGDDVSYNWDNGIGAPAAVILAAGGTGTFNGNYNHTYTTPQASPGYPVSFSCNDVTNSISGNNSFAVIVNASGPQPPQQQVNIPNIFVAKFDSTGRYMWSRAAGGSEIDQGLDISFESADGGGTGDPYAPAPTGRVVVAGSFSGSASFSGVNNSFGLTSKGGSDAFAASYSSSTGELDWVHPYGSVSNDLISGISFSSDGKLYIAGIAGGDTRQDYDPLAAADSHFTSNAPVHQSASVFDAFKKWFRGKTAKVQAAPVAARAYITNSGSGSVSIIDAVTHEVINTVNAVGNFPFGVAVVPDGSYAYVTNFLGGTVAKINPSGSIVATITGLGTNPQGIAVTPNGSFAYVANYSGGGVSVINTETNTVITDISVGNSPLGVATTPDGAFVYVTNYGDNTVSKISTETNTVVATITLDNNAPQGITISPDGAYVYTVDNGSASPHLVFKINTSTNLVEATTAVGNNPAGIAISPDGAFIFVANYDDNTISKINTATNTVVATISVGTNPYGVSVTPSGSYLYVANYGSNNVSVVDISTETVLTTINVGTGPFAFGSFIGPVPVTPPSDTTAPRILNYSPVACDTSNPPVATVLLAIDITANCNYNAGASSSINLGGTVTDDVGIALFTIDVTTPTGASNGNIFQYPTGPAAAILAAGPTPPDFDFNYTFPDGAGTYIFDEYARDAAGNAVLLRKTVTYSPSGGGGGDTTAPRTINSGPVNCDSNSFLAISNFNVAAPPSSTCSTFDTAESSVNLTGTVTDSVEVASFTIDVTTPTGTSNRRIYPPGDPASVILAAGDPGTLEFNVNYAFPDGAGRYTFTEIATDAAGNSTTIVKPVNYSPSIPSGISNLGYLAATSADIFVAQLDPNDGDVNWVRGAKTTSSVNPKLALGTGNVAVTGDFTGTAYVDGGIGAGYTRPAAAFQCQNQQQFGMANFLKKFTPTALAGTAIDNDTIAFSYDSEGNLAWVNTAGQNLQDYPGGIARAIYADEESFFVTGSFNSCDLSFVPPALHVLNTQTESFDTFLAQLSVVANGDGDSEPGVSEPTLDFATPGSSVSLSQIKKGTRMAVDPAVRLAMPAGGIDNGAGVILAAFSPTLSAVTSSPESVTTLTSGTENTYSFTTNISDPSLACNMDWGDGTPLENAIITESNPVATVILAAEGPTLNGSLAHTYSTPGNYQVTVSCTFSGGGEEIFSSNTSVAVSAPPDSTADWIRADCRLGGRAVLGQDYFFSSGVASREDPALYTNCVEIDPDVYPGGFGQANRSYVLSKLISKALAAAAPVVNLQVTNNGNIGPNQTVTVTLENLTNAVFGPNQTYTLNIINDNGGTTSGGGYLPITPGGGIITTPGGGVPPSGGGDVCPVYLSQFIYPDGRRNDPTAVRLLKAFLEKYEGEKNLPETGVYDRLTINAVRKFQNKYAEAILSRPWGLDHDTGIVYKSTLFAINEIVCGRTPKAPFMASERTGSTPPAKTPGAVPEAPSGTGDGTGTPSAPSGGSGGDTTSGGGTTSGTTSEPTAPGEAPPPSQGFTPQGPLIQEGDIAPTPPPAQQTQYPVIGGTEAPRVTPPVEAPSLVQKTFQKIVTGFVETLINIIDGILRFFSGGN